MSGGNSVVGLWRDRDAAHDQVEAPDVSPIAYDQDDSESAGALATSQWGRRMASGLAISIAFGWVGALAFSRFLASGTATVSATTVVEFIASAAGPLVLLAILGIAINRSGQGEQRRFLDTASALRSEEERLEATLRTIAGRLDTNRVAMAEQSDLLSRVGEGASERLKLTTETIQAEIETIAQNMQILKGAAAAARGDLAVLLANLPKAQVQTRQMVAALQEAGLTAHEKAGALDAQLSLLTVRGREADEIAGNAAQKLAAHLSRMEGVSEVAGARLEQAAGQMTGAVDEALERAAEALQTARQGMEAQGAAMLAMVEQNQAAMSKTGAESTEAIAQRITLISEQVDKVALTFAAQDAASERLMARMSEDLGAIETRFSAFDASGIERTERLGTAIGALRNHADDLSNALSGGGDTANALVDKVESLMTALNGVSNEIDQALPAAYAKLEAQARSSIETAHAATPIVSQLATHAQTALAQLSESETVVNRQRVALENVAALTLEQLTQARQGAEELATSIAVAAADAKQLTDATAPQLVESLVRVRETASQASLHVRNAFADIIEQSAKSLGEKSREALLTALTDQVETQLAAIAQTSEDAVSSAQKATDRLMRQMLTIADTSAALESRITEAKQEIENSDQANFARRVALLVESLNSTAIDVTKILSNEVTDIAWAAYLRGDRGVFTRRAVKLLDAGEVREIGRHYDAEPEFREQVNRYIHDFEAMLRNILATRDGTPLSVTLLSSDTGKLYVALAQAIERLR